MKTEQSGPKALVFCLPPPWINTFKFKMSINNVTLIEL